MKDTSSENSSNPQIYGRVEIGLALGFVCLIVLLMVWPNIDLVLSGLFFTKGVGFVQSPVLNFVRASLPYWIGGAVGFAFAMMKCGVISRKALLFIVLAFAVGPGLVVNGVFKEHWGRARPAQVEPFGGKAQFTPVWLPTNQCDHNCSFTAGDPSVGFAFIAFAFVWPTRRKAIVAGTVLAGGALGLIRIAQGGHFASDVLFTGLVVLITTAVLARLFRPIQARPHVGL